jgi:hypothetical protein
MTKKHFIVLADYIRNSPVKFTDRHLNELANFCASQNPNFDRVRWLNYIDGKCGPSGGKRGL